MRCYFMRKGHIAAVEILDEGSDEFLIEQARTHFQECSEIGFEGFEVWDRARRVYTWPEDAPTPG